MDMKEEKGIKAQPEDVRSGNIEEILRERDRLEQILRERFEKEVVILFTDICGYTRHTDIHGDVSGLTLIQRHNQIVLPIIEKHRGMVVKTIGDAVMASFSNSLDAVKAAVDIQKGLHEYNCTVEESDRIHVKIGINIGQALVDQADIHGDVVNVASRIQTQAGPDQILVSSRIYEQVRGIEHILCRSCGAARVKGKAEPLELYRVVWRDEDIILGPEPRVRAFGGGALSSSSEDGKQRVFMAQGAPVAQGASVAAVRLIQLEVARHEAHLKISINERMSGEESTLCNYEEVPVSMDWIKTRCHEMVETLNKVSRQGRFSLEVLLKLRAMGRVFYNELLTPSVKAKLRETKAEYLCLNIDDQLVQVPWELLYDGQEFLCQRFNMGRLVKTRQAVQGIKTRVLAKPLRILIIADPSGDLKDAYREGVQIQEHLAHYGNFINAALRSQNITPAYIKEKLRYFDLVHFAGHADYSQENPEKGGWRLTKGTLTAQDVIRMGGSSTMPSLIFSNACQSARTEEWVLKEHFQDEIYGLAHAFLLSGVKHYVGTFWEILDEPGSQFAMEFYKYLLSGLTTGEAVREARLSLIRRYGEETVVWASYLLYGDPTSNYLNQIQAAEAGKETRQQDTGRVNIPDTLDTSAPCASWERARAGTGAESGTDTGQGPGGAGAGKRVPDDAAGPGCEPFDNTASSSHASMVRQWALAAAGGSLFLLLLVLFIVRFQHNAGPILPNQPFSQGQGPGAVLSQPSGDAVRSAGLDSDFQKSMQIIQLLFAYQDQLNSKLREKGFFTREKESDTWTSLPLSIAIILPDWERIDANTARVVKPHFDLLFKEMVEAFTRTHTLGLSILERARLAAIVQELEIGTLSTDALKGAGDILSAQVILFPEPVFYPFSQAGHIGQTRQPGHAGQHAEQASQTSHAGQASQDRQPGQTGQTGQIDQTGQAAQRIEPQVSLRLVETKSTRIISAFSGTFSLEQPDSLSRAASDLVNKTIKVLQDQYPLQGRVVSCSDQSVEINLGAGVGILKDQSFKVLDQTKNELPKGTIRIKSIYEHTALAEVLDRQSEFKVGDRVKALNSGQ
ncbi:MAG: CHAT domain-containing protein [bacterium]